MSCIVVMSSYGVSPLCKLTAHEAQGWWSWSCKNDLAYITDNTSAISPSGADETETHWRIVPPAILCSVTAAAAAAAAAVAVRVKTGVTPAILSRRFFSRHFIARWSRSVRLCSCTPRLCRVMGLLQLRYEHDSSTIRLRFDYDSATTRYEMRTIRVRYNILRGVMCFRAIMNMSILSRCCRML